MKYSINPISAEDRKSIIDIFNYYIENSFAAYPENKLPYQTFDMFLQISNYSPTGTIKDQDGKIVDNWGQIFDIDFLELTLLNPCNDCLFYSPKLTE